MLLLTEDATLYCTHAPGGRVRITPSQRLVTIGGRQVLVEKDPERRPIQGCPLPPPQRPCLLTLNVEKGYSDWLRIEGRRICLDTTTGVTDGDPIGTVSYIVRDPGQAFVAEAA